VLKVAGNLVAMGALVALGVALIANSGPDPPPEKPPLQIEAMTDAPPVPLDIELVLPFGEDFVPFSIWPQACDLLSDDEIRSVLPQTEQVRRESESEYFEQTINGLPSGETVPAPGVNCDYELDIPGAGLGFEDGSSASIDLRVYAVGSPSIVELNFDEREDRFEVTGGECSAGTNFGLSCHSEAVAFALELTASHPDMTSETRHSLETTFAERVLAKLPTTTPGPPLQP
jgi:hypothetical protein